MRLKVYADRTSQPSRAVLVFCKAIGIEFEEVKIDIVKMQHYSPEYGEVNPMRQVPAIVHGDFKLFESHAILKYVATAFPGVPEHWYPSDAHKRAKIDSVLDWHHANLRRASVGYVYNSTISLVFGVPLNPRAAREYESFLSKSLETIETFWLEDGPFMHGNKEPSISDIALVCEVMQIELVEDEDRQRILGRHKKIVRWIEEIKKAVNPHFQEIHSIMPPTKEMVTKLKVQANKHKR